MDMNINGFWLFLAQLMEVLTTIVALPSMVLGSLSSALYIAAGVGMNNGNNVGGDEQE